MNKEVRKTAMLLGSALLAASSLAQGGELTDNVDRFSGDRSIVWRALPATKDEFSFSSTVVVREGGARRAYDGNLITYGSRGRFANCNQSLWLVDGRRAPNIQTEYKSTRTSDSVIELFYLTDPKEMLPVLAAAKTVEFRICNQEGQISKADLEGIRQVLERAGESN